jgi:pimeloyl-ACP methyl ester carboxylesterase
MGVCFSPEVTAEQAQAYAAAFFVPGMTPPRDPFTTDILLTDGHARAGLATSTKPDGYQDEVEIVGNLSIPLAIFHGVEEQLVNEAYLSKLTMPTLWHHKVQTIAGAGHAPHWEQAEEFNGLLAAFVGDVNQ